MVGAFHHASHHYAHQCQQCTPYLPHLPRPRRRRLGLIEKTFDALPVDDAVAREYGRLAAELVQAGRQARARIADLLIAATARTQAPSYGPETVRTSSDWSS